MFVYRSAEKKHEIPVPLNLVSRDDGVAIRCERCRGKKSRLSSLTVEAGVNLCVTCVKEVQSGEGFYECMQYAEFPVRGVAVLIAIMVAFVIGLAIGGSI